MRPIEKVNSRVTNFCSEWRTAIDVKEKIGYTGAGASKVLKRLYEMGYLEIDRSEQKLEYKALRPYSTTECKIVRLLQEQPLTSTEIAKNTKDKMYNIFNALQILIKEDKVEKIAGSKYKIKIKQRQPIYENKPFPSW